MWLNMNNIQDLADLQSRLRKMVVGSSRAGEPITADDIGVAGMESTYIRPLNHHARCHGSADERRRATYSHANT